MPPLRAGRRLRTICAITALLTAGLLAGACSGSKAPSTPTPVPDHPTILTISNYTFAKITVKASSTIQIHNTDSVQHTLSAENGAFNVAIDPRRDGAFPAPPKPGIYKFHCQIHTRMHGVLTVTR